MGGYFRTRSGRPLHRGIASYFFERVVMQASSAKKCRNGLDMRILRPLRVTPIFSTNQKKTWQRKLARLFLLIVVLQFDTSDYKIVAKFVAGAIFR